MKKKKKVDVSERLCPVDLNYDKVDGHNTLI